MIKSEDYFTKLDRWFEEYGSAGKSMVVEKYSYPILGLKTGMAYDENLKVEIAELFKKKLQTNKEKLAFANYILNEAARNLKTESLKEKYLSRLKNELWARLKVVAVGETITRPAYENVKNTLTKEGYEEEIIQAILSEHGIKIVSNTRKDVIIKSVGGTPKIIIRNNEDAEKGTLNFEGVKRNEVYQTQLEIINGGGGALEALIKTNKPWLQVTPARIEQVNLPQKVTLRVMPSKAKTKDLEFSDNGLITITEVNTGQTLRIKVELATEDAFFYAQRKLKRTVLACYAALIVSYFFAAFLLPALLQRTRLYSEWHLLSLLGGGSLFIYSLYGFVRGGVAYGKHFLMGAVLFAFGTMGNLAFVITSVVTGLVVRKRIYQRPQAPYTGLVAAASAFLVSMVGYTYLEAVKPQGYGSFFNSSPPVHYEIKYARVTAKNGVNIRLTPDENSRVIRTAQLNETLELRGQDSTTGWYQVLLKDGSFGYVTPRYVTLE